MGFSDNRFVLPELIERQHEVAVRKIAEGLLFTIPARGLKEERDERRRSITERCEKVAELVANHKDQSLVWCHLNPEGNLLEQMIPGSVQVAGQDDDEFKEHALSEFATGNIKCLISKPKIAGFGLNFQGCNHETFFPSHSWEQYYQGVRRCWRFGQKRTVTIDIIVTEGEKRVQENLQRKAQQADQMFAALCLEMNNSLRIKAGINFEKAEEIPPWL
jgi:hypothetical protein